MILNIALISLASFSAAINALPKESSKEPLSLLRPFKERVNFGQAAKLCQSKGYQLADINAANLDSALSIVKRNGQSWIGTYQEKGTISCQVLMPDGQVVSQECTNRNAVICQVQMLEFRVIPSFSGVMSFDQYVADLVGSRALGIDKLAINNINLQRGKPIENAKYSINSVIDGGKYREYADFLKSLKVKYSTGVAIVFNSSKSTPEERVFFLAAFNLSFDSVVFGLNGTVAYFMNDDKHSLNRIPGVAVEKILAF